MCQLRQSRYNAAHILYALKVEATHSHLCSTISGCSISRWPNGNGHAHELVAGLAYISDYCCALLLRAPAMRLPFACQHQCDDITCLAQSKSAPAAGLNMFSNQRAGWGCPDCKFCILKANSGKEKDPCLATSARQGTFAFWLLALCTQGNHSQHLAGADAAPQESSAQKHLRGTALAYLLNSLRQHFARLPC